MTFGIVLHGHNMKSKFKAFSLLETTLYIGIFSIFMGVVVMFAINVLMTSSRYQAQSEVNDTLYFISKKISHDIKNATDIAIPNSNEIIIYSNSSDRTEVKYVLQSGRIKFGIKTSTNCNYVNLCSLNSNFIEVTKFDFSSIESVTNEEILVQYKMDLKYMPNNKVSSFEYSNGIENIVAIRSL